MTSNRFTATFLGMFGSQRPETVVALEGLLRDSLRLRDLALAFHWNVTGPMFPMLHELFGDQYEDLVEAVDSIAERLRQFGQRPSSQSGGSGIDVGKPALHMVCELAEAHEDLAEACDRCVRVAEGDGDSATVDLVGKRAAAHRKAAWFLRSTAGKG